MSARYAAFRRQPVDPPYAQHLQTATIPAPMRGLILNENESFMAPGGTLMHDNWFPTLQGVKLRGGCQRWCDLHALDTTVPPVPDASRLPAISAFEYAYGNVQKMFAANSQKLFEVTANTPVLIRSGHASGNYCAAQLANASGSYLLAVNDGGDYAMRFDGTAWTTLDGGQLVAPPPPEFVGTWDQKGLTYVWKYRNRLFFIRGGTMEAWYLPLNAVQGQMHIIPLSGAAAKGGKLLWGATWSLDAGDGIDEKCVFGTDLGELLIFTGTDPSDPNNWRQEGRYAVAPPMGMNAHFQLGGDLMILTVDGIVPISAAITKSSGQLELAMITRTIEPLWHEEANAKRGWSWSAKNWDEYSGIFITTPGDPIGKRHCLVANSTTGAWARYLGYDATCFIRMRGDMYFGTQDGLIQQADRTGFDDARLMPDGITLTGTPYTATLVGGWEMFGSPSSEIVWHQARASFKTSASETFVPQLTATVDYQIVVPPPPPPGPDPGPQVGWDGGLWDAAHWDAPVTTVLPVRNTGWVSIGMTGFAHAPILQVQIAQQAKPAVELISIAATYERAGVNV